MKAMQNRYFSFFLLISLFFLNVNKSFSEDEFPPLDINKDGNVNVADIVTANSQGLPTIVSEMIMKYYQMINFHLVEDG